MTMLDWEAFLLPRKGAAMIYIDMRQKPCRGLQVEPIANDTVVTKIEIATRERGRRYAVEITS